jgi:SOS response regulatory protein OraA/RecX
LKARGRLRILRELEARGFSRELAREAIAELPADEDLATIQRIVARKRPTMDDGPAGRARLFNQLLRRGFPAELIAKVLRTRD